MFSSHLLLNKTVPATKTPNNFIFTNSNLQIPTFCLPRNDLPLDDRFPSYPNMSKAWANIPKGKPSIDHTVLENYKMAPFDYSYTEKDLIVYGLGVGFGSDSQVTDRSLQNVYDSHENFGIFPSFATIPPFQAIADVVSLPKLVFNPMMLVHGETEFTIHKPCSTLPTSGTLTTNAVISGVYDKKSGASIEITATTLDPKTKQTLFTNVMTLFIRGLGGFNGASGPANKALIPLNIAADAIPAKSITYKTTLNQALLYRLSGDTNPLHADPKLAQLGGFKQPILHGLCTLGHSVRGLTELHCNDDRDRVVNVKCRFMKPVFPGQSLTVQVFAPKIVDIPDVTKANQPNQPNAEYELVFFRTTCVETNEVVLIAYALLTPPNAIKEAKL